MDAGAVSRPLLARSVLLLARGYELAARGDNDDLLLMRPRETSKVTRLAEPGPSVLDRPVRATGTQVGVVTFDASSGALRIGDAEEYRLAMFGRQHARARLAEDGPAPLAGPSEADALLRRE